MDKAIQWYYGQLNKMGIVSNLDKWLHATLMCIWSFAGGLTGYPEWTFISVVIIIVGRELYNVGQALVEGFTWWYSWSKFSIRDIYAGLAGFVLGIIPSLLIYKWFML